MVIKSINAQTAIDAAKQGDRVTKDEAVSSTTADQRIHEREIQHPGLGYVLALLTTIQQCPNAVRIQAMQ